MGRGHVLDVKLRSNQVRATRTRLAALAFGVVFGTVFGLYLLWRIGGWALDHFVYENRAFAIQQIEVQTDGVIPAEQLRRWAGVRLGENLLALDLARVKRDLELVPLIGSVSVERILPRTLRIHVTEREPVAQVNVVRRDVRGRVEITVFEIDAEGYVMLPLDPQQRATLISQTNDLLPVLDGINPILPQSGRRIESPQVQAALQLVAEFSRSPMAGLVDLERINVSTPEVLVVTTRQGSEVTFGLANLDQQLLRWWKVHQECLRYNISIATLDLAVTDSTPLMFREAGAEPAVAPRPARTLRNKPKHV